jgi:hypothetical protein
MLPSETLLPLALLVALSLALTLYVLAASGHFPRAHRAPVWASSFGQFVLYGSIVIAIICLLIAIMAAWRLVPWYAAIIGSGLAVLCAPLVLQQFTDRFVDGCGALLTFSGACAVLALLLILIEVMAASHP